MWIEQQRKKKFYVAPHRKREKEKEGWRERVKECKSKAGEGEGILLNCKSYLVFLCVIYLLKDFIHWGERE